MRSHGCWIATVCASVVLWGAVSEAHHFKGLPHFSYFENYPQVPQEEFLGQAGEFEFSLVLYDFQGIQREDVEQPDNARFYLIAYNLRENKVYNGPATLEILDRGTQVVSEYLPSSQEESIYTLHRVLPPQGKYALEITLHEAENLKAVIPFKLSSQKVHWGKWVAGCLVVLISIVAVGSRRARVAMDRKQNAAARRRREETEGRPVTGEQGVVNP